MKMTWQLPIGVKSYWATGVAANINKHLCKVFIVVALIAQVAGF